MKIKWLIMITLVSIWSLPMNSWADPIKPGFFLVEIKTAEIEFKGKRIPLKKTKPSKFTEFRLMAGLSDIGQVDTELVSMSLTGFAPVSIGGANSFFDVFVELDSPAIGELMVTEHDTSGGRAEFNMPLSLLVELVPVSGNGNSMSQVINVDIMSTDFSWLHEPPPLYPTIPNAPISNFFPGDFGITNGVFSASFTPATIPEASTLALLGTGLMLLGIGRRRSKAR